MSFCIVLLVDDGDGISITNEKFTKVSLFGNTALIGVSTKLDKDKVELEYDMSSPADPVFETNQGLIANLKIKFGDHNYGKDDKSTGKNRVYNQKTPIADNKGGLIANVELANVEIDVAPMTYANDIKDDDNFGYYVFAGGSEGKNNEKRGKLIACSVSHYHLYGGITADSKYVQFHANSDVIYDEDKEMYVISVEYYEK